MKPTKTYPMTETVSTIEEAILKKIVVLHSEKVIPYLHLAELYGV
jgi:hypothetical protein